MLHLLVLGGGSIGASLLYAGKRLIQKQAAKNTTSALTTQPNQQLTPSNTDSSAQEAEKKQLKEYLMTASAGLATAVVGEFFLPILLLPAVALILYSCVPIFESLHQAFTEKKFKSSIVDVIAMVGALSMRYYVASAATCVVYLVAQRLLLETEDQSKQQMMNVFANQPRTVWLFKEGIEIEIAFEQVAVGDILVVHTGELIPIDGIIIDGNASIDQRIMTGEAQPIEGQVGDSVLAGTMLVSGKLLVQVEHCGESTAAAKITHILRNTSDFRASVEAKSQQLSDRLVIPTLATGALGLVALGPVSSIALISCNFSEIIRVTAPIGVLNFLKLATEQGILIKDGRSLELLSDVDTVVFDKTGTLTLEQPHIGLIHSWSNYSEDQVLVFAAAAEFKQTHPIARAILQAARERQLDVPLIENAKYDIGYGIKVELQQQIVQVGSYRFMALLEIEMSLAAHDLQADSDANGHSAVYIAVDGKLIGAVELHVTVRPEAQTVIEQLQKRGLTLYILSGDQEKPTQQLAETLGIDHYFAQTLPENKARRIEALQQQGKSVCFIGDGINDTIALKKAHVSISLQGASNAAMDSAGIILMEKNLAQLPKLFDLSEGLSDNIKHSFASALIPGVIGIGGVFLFHFGIYSSLLLYISSLGVGTANAMKPLLGVSTTEREDERQS